MTTREARTVVRRVYDQWVALAKLHEALEVAETAEAAVTGLEGRRSALTAEIDALLRRRETTVHEAEDELVRLRGDIDAARSAREAAIRESREAVVTAERTAAARMDAIAADLARMDAGHADAVQAHDARLAGLAAAEREAQARVDRLAAELAAMKSRIAAA